MGVLTIAFALCYLWGEKLESRRKGKVKKHGYRAKCPFRRGFESLHTMLDRPYRYTRSLWEFFEVVVSRPPARNLVA